LTQQQAAGTLLNAKAYPSATARFVLVGSAPKRELRPQLLDRFGMQIRTVKEPALRVQIVEQRAEFDQNPQQFLETYQPQQEELQQKLVSLKLLPSVQIDYDYGENIRSLF